MTYLDTSILVPLYVREQTSDELRRWLSAMRPDQLITSEWTRVEFTSAIGINVRSGRLDSQVARDILSAFGKFLDSMSVLLAEVGDFTLASRYMHQFELGLRAGDALHLAVAANHGVRRVCSLDRLLVQAGQKLGINAEIPI